jgi:hypothetical protein
MTPFLPVVLLANTVMGQGGAFSKSIFQLCHWLALAFNK